MGNLIQQIINGLTLGCIYGLLALSYTLIFGALRVINFALGETLMVGAFSSIGVAWLCQRWGLCQHSRPGLFVLTLLAALAAGVVVALLTELCAFRPLRRKKDTPMLLGLISSLGVSIFLQNLVLTKINSGNVNFPAVVPDQRFTFLGASMTTVQAAIIVMSLVLMAGLSALVYNTRLGQHIRAVRDNAGLACEHGVNPNRVITVTFAISGLLAGFAGFAMGCQYGIARYNMGFVPGIKAFSAAVLGGVGDVPGGVLGGMLIGLIEALGSGYVSTANKDVLVFAALILTLLFRPRGLLGRGIE